MLPPALIWVSTMWRTNTVASSPSVWSLLLISLVASFYIHRVSAADGQAIMKNGLTAIHFERSGGLFALGKPLGADIVFSESSGVVRPMGGGPSRPLTGAEMALFAQLDPARLREFAQARGSGPPGLPDDYQFDIVLTFNDGSNVKLTFHGQSLADLRGAPGVAELAAWVLAEIDRIWSAR
jgi:hypothetical protein